MSIPVRLLTVAAVVALVSACGSTKQANSSLQLPGDTAGRPGLEVPPDAWAHPPIQAAAPSGQR